MVFPYGTSGFQLDLVARAPLWAAGLDYAHGTGHGVGHFLNVHEGPQGISFNLKSHETPLAPGMTVTNEPGYYEEGAFGIRIENVLLVRQYPIINNETNADAGKSTPGDDNHKQFLCFENLTMVPIQTSLLDLSLMDQSDIDHLNEYHAKCWTTVSPFLEPGSPGYEWLKEWTQPITYTTQ